MIAARLAGYRGVTAFGEFAARLSQAQLRAVGAFFSPSRRRRAGGHGRQKDVRGASRQIDGERRMMVAKVAHGTGLVLGQVQVGDKTNEIPAVHELTRALGLEGRVVTLDVLHAQQETARALVEDCGADYVRLKGARPAEPGALAALDPAAAEDNATERTAAGRGMKCPGLRRCASRAPWIG